MRDRAEEHDLVAALHVRELLEAVLSGDDESRRRFAVRVGALGAHAVEAGRRAVACERELRARGDARAVGPRRRDDELQLSTLIDERTQLARRRRGVEHAPHTPAPTDRLLAHDLQVRRHSGGEREHEHEEPQHGARMSEPSRCGTLS